MVTEIIVIPVTYSERSTDLPFRGDYCILLVADKSCRTVDISIYSWDDDNDIVRCEVEFIRLELFDCFLDECFMAFPVVSPLRFGETVIETTPPDACFSRD